MNEQEAKQQYDALKVAAKRAENELLALRKAKYEKQIVLISYYSSDDQRKNDVVSRLVGYCNRIQLEVIETTPWIGGSCNHQAIKFSQLIDMRVIEGAM